MTGNLLDKTENQQDRRPYYCTWSRATPYYLGVVVGEGIGALIVTLTKVPSWMTVAFSVTMVFFAICAVYYDLLRRNEPVEEKITEKGN